MPFSETVPQLSSLRIFAIKEDQQPLLSRSSHSQLSKISLGSSQSRRQVAKIPYLHNRSSSSGAAAATTAHSKKERKEIEAPRVQSRRVHTHAYTNTHTHRHTHRNPRLHCARGWLLVVGLHRITHKPSSVPAISSRGSVATTSVLLQCTAENYRASDQRSSALAQVQRLVYLYLVHVHEAAETTMTRRR